MFQSKHPTTYVPSGYVKNYGETIAEGITRDLARTSHQLTAAGAHLPESTAPCSDKGLDVLSSTPVCFVSLAPCISGHLHTLASLSGEKSGLVLMLIEPPDALDRKYLGKGKDGYSNGPFQE